MLSCCCGLRTGSAGARALSQHADRAATPLETFAREGALFAPSLGAAAAQFDASNWADLARTAYSALGVAGAGGESAGFSDAACSPALRKRVHHLYLPLYAWIRGRTEVRRGGDGAGAGAGAGPGAGSCEVGGADGGAGGGVGGGAGGSECGGASSTGWVGGSVSGGARESDNGDVGGAGSAGCAGNADAADAPFAPVAPVVPVARIVDNSNGSPTLVVGLSCPQGGGKTTLSYVLKALAEADMGARCEVMSIDDFYLTFAEQQALAAEHAGNRLLSVRGNPGTHDLALAARTLRDLRVLGPGATLRVPRYDKAAHGGRGDRAPEAEWSTVTGPIDILLFEGWCLGFESVSSVPCSSVGSTENAESVDCVAAGGGMEKDTDTKSGMVRDTPSIGDQPTGLAPGVAADLVPVNDRLSEYEESLYPLLDSFITVKVANTAWVYAWREQAEAALRAEGRGAMTKAEVVAFVDCYMPAYNTYLPGLYEGPQFMEGKNDDVLAFYIDEGRQPGVG